MGVSGSETTSMKALTSEYGMADCNSKEKHLAKDGPEKSGMWEPLVGERASMARRGIAIVNCMAQDRPDMAVAARVQPQRMSAPTQGTKHCLKTARFLECALGSWRFVWTKGC